MIIDTSGSMSVELWGKALGSIVSYAEAKDVALVRVVFCDAVAYDIGYVRPSDLAGRVQVIRQRWNKVATGSGLFGKGVGFSYKWTNLNYY